MPFNVLIVPLIAGFYLLTTSYRYRYRYQRTESRRLILNAAIAGLVIAAISLVVKFILTSLLFLDLSTIKEVLRSIVKIDQNNSPYLWTVLVGLISTYIFCKLDNLRIDRNPEAKARIALKAVQEYGNELEQLFANSVIFQWPVQITLKNNKVYLGYVDEIPAPGRTNYLNIMPLYSGYRRDDDKRLILTTSYETVKDLLDEKSKEEKIQKMTVVIKQDEILSASPHDHEVYERFIHSEK